MSLERREIIEVVEEVLEREQVKRSVIYWNARTVKEGEEVTPGPQRLKMPFEGTVVFVDLSPRANWAHPCLYLFIGHGTPRTRVVESSLPPPMDRPGDRWAVILRNGEESLA